MKLKRSAKVAIAVCIAGIVVMLGLIFVPYAHPFSGQSFSNTAYRTGLEGTDINFPINAQVSFSWSVESGDVVGFVVLLGGDYSTAACPMVNASSGSCSFTATDGLYHFTEQPYPVTLPNAPNETVTWSGTYTAPFVSIT